MVHNRNQVWKPSFQSLFTKRKQSDSENNNQKWEFFLNIEIEFQARSSRRRQHRDDAGSRPSADHRQQHHADQPVWRGGHPSSGTRHGAQTQHNTDAPRGRSEYRDQPAWPETGSTRSSNHSPATDVAKLETGTGHSDWPSRSSISKN